MKPARIRTVYDLAGVVQGVGFRPSIYRLASESDLAGWVRNRSGTVQVAFEGPPDAITALVETLPSRLPPNCRIDTMREVCRTPVAPSEASAEFRILESEGDQRVEIVIPADLAICPDCRQEILDPDNRRYGYAFTTCTNCGPRYTVVTAMPYDRERTTLAHFPLCSDCRREYENPNDRRFHAESMACPVCGPTLTLEMPNGPAIDDDPLPTTRRAISEGRIVGVMGIGGFLLAANAFNRDTLHELRERKRRPHKPFAVMARDLDVLRRFAEVSPAAERLLLSPESPIVILDMLPDAGRNRQLPVDMITPDGDTLGAMLPTSPLHELLFHPIGEDALPPFDLLIMTSGNRRGEPICRTPAEARVRLDGIADLLLLHDREIHLRNDDSLCVDHGGRGQVWRRARGYAPQPVHLAQRVDRCVLAMGAELKNAIAMAYDDRVVLSPHVGDLDTPEAVEGLEQVVRSFPLFLDRDPEVIAVDLHPDMACTKLGIDKAQRDGLPLVEVQHHHAHGAACLAENGRESGLALTLDGTGLGNDGTIWGAELLDIDPSGFRRLATFAGVPLPGGDAAVTHPVRQLVGRWAVAGMDITPQWRDRLGVSEEESTIWSQQSLKGVNAPVTHAAGRVFDAFSVLLGFAPSTTTYDGQSAIRLESAARHAGGDSLPNVPFTAREFDGMLRIDWSEAFRMLAETDCIYKNRHDWALAVHHAVVKACLAMLNYGICRSGARAVALSGGVFMNRILNDLLVPEMENQGLQVLRHKQVPPNDGGIALGQSVIAGR